MRPNGLQARVAQQNFQHVARRWVAVEDGLNILANDVEHSDSLSNNLQRAPQIFPWSAFVE
jgi:hypothetical protein